MNSVLPFGAALCEYLNEQTVGGLGDLNGTCTFVFQTVPRRLC